MKAKKWIGTPPTQCVICKAEITSEFVDGRTELGPWANMCMNCHETIGLGLGLGYGQHYKLTGDDWVKVEG